MLLAELLGVVGVHIETRLNASILNFQAFMSNTKPQSTSLFDCEITKFETHHSAKFIKQAE